MKDCLPCAFRGYPISPDPRVGLVLGVAVYGRRFALKTFCEMNEGVEGGNEEKASSLSALIRLYPVKSQE